MLHDNTINRTGRHKNGDLIADPVKIGDITYEEALRYDFGLWFSSDFEGTRIPLFEDVLRFARQNQIKLKIDNKYQRFTQEQKGAFFEALSALVKQYASLGVWILSDEIQLAEAEKLGADVVETNGQLKPTRAHIL